MAAKGNSSASDAASIRASTCANVAEDGSCAHASDRPGSERDSLRVEADSTAESCNRLTRFYEFDTSIAADRMTMMSCSGNSEQLVGNTRRACRGSQMSGIATNPLVGPSAGACIGMRLFGNLRAHRDGLTSNAVFKVSDMYQKDGCFQLIAQNKHFGNFTLAVICVNAVYMGVEADYNREGSSLEGHMVFVIFDNGFCGFFLMEIIVRFGAFARKLDCLKDTWFKFDTCLVGLMIFETWVSPFVLGGTGDAAPDMGALRLLRLTRLARMTRLLRSVPELWTLTKGMRAATRAVSATLVLLVCIIYIFAIAFRGIVSADGLEENFGSLAKCMWVLLMTGTFMDNITGILELLMIHQPMLVFLFLLFVLLSALTVMNMLIGVLCEVVSAVACAEQETDAMEQVKATLTNVLGNLDQDSDGMLSREEILSLLDHAKAMETLQDTGICTDFLVDYIDVLFDAEEGTECTATISTQALANMMWSWQSSSNVAVKTVVEQTEILKTRVDKHRKMTMNQISNLESQQHKLRQRFSGVSTQLTKLRQQVKILANEMNYQPPLPPLQLQLQPLHQPQFQKPPTDSFAKCESPLGSEVAQHRGAMKERSADAGDKNHGGCGDAAAGEGSKQQQQQLQTPEPKPQPSPPPPDVSLPIPQPQPQQMQSLQSQRAMNSPLLL